MVAEAAERAPSHIGFGDPILLCRSGVAQRVNWYRFEACSDVLWGVGSAGEQNGAGRRSQTRINKIMSRIISYLTIVCASPDMIRHQEMIWDDQQLWIGDPIFGWQPEISDRFWSGPWSLLPPYDILWHQEKKWHADGGVVKVFKPAGVQSDTQLFQLHYQKGQRAGVQNWQFSATL